MATKPRQRPAPSAAQVLFDPEQRRRGGPFALPESPEPVVEDPTAPVIDPEDEELLARKAKGRAATILTSGKGLLGDAPTAMKTLLGS